MQFKRKIAIPLAACSMGVVAALSGATTGHAAVGGGPVLALTANNVLVGFDIVNPTALTQNTPITGLQPGETIVGIDVRPATGQMYAIAVAGTTGRVYTLNTSNGVATPVGTAPFSTTLPAGGTWSVDFNPTADRIRLVHSGGTSYRVNQLNGTLAATDTSVTGATANALAYDRSVSTTPAATTLFAIDATTDRLVTIGGVNGTPSPNLGAATTVGPLGIDADATSIGFDIAPQGDAIASLDVAGFAGLYSINLTTGAAGALGIIGDGSLDIRDISLPRPPVGAMVALAPNNTLLAFDASSPNVSTTVAITGLQPGEVIVGFDVRPATGELIAVGLAGTSGRVYRLDIATGKATQIGTAPFTVTAAAPTWSVDFNPTVDRIRLTNSLGDSYRVNPVTGALVQADTDIAPAKPSAVAYDRSVATTAATTLYAIDDVTETLNIIGGPDGTPSPNLGATTLRGPLGVVTDDDEVGFDISPIGEAVASLSVGGSTGLFTVDLASGTARLIAPIGTGTTDVLDVAFVAKFAPGGSQFTPVTASRLLDTRTTGVKPGPNSVTELQITGAGGVPANATAVVLNTTATDATAPGFVTVYPTGEAQPLASNLNLITGQTRANVVTVKLGATGKVSIFSQSGTHLVADVLGYYAPATGTAGRFTALTPSRVIDTRQSTKVAPDGTVDVTVLGKGGVPATGVSSVLVNLAGTDATLPGFVTAYATGTNRPSTSNLNLERTGSTSSNLAIVPIGTDGKITVYSQQGAQIIVDVAGWFGDATAKGGYSGLFVPVSPSRVLDTRTGTGAPAGALAIETGLDLTLAGVGGVPANGASSALLNLTAVESPQAGFVTVYPSGSPLTAVSSLNVDVAGQTTPNLVGATIGAGGKVTIFTQAGGHLVADVAGWYTS